MDLNFDFTEKRVILTVFFCMAFTIANLITVKIININFLGMETPAGVLIYPLVYILTNVIADVYGERTAQRTLILGIAADVLFVFMTTLILFLPSPDFFTGDTIVNKGTDYSSIKNYAVIGFSQLVDNFVFIGLAFVGMYSVVDILIMIFTHWLLSLIWSAIAQPFTTMTVRWAEKGKPAEA